MNKRQGSYSKDTPSHPKFSFGEGRGHRRQRQRQSIKGDELQGQPETQTEWKLRARDLPLFKGNRVQAQKRRIKNLTWQCQLL